MTAANCACGGLTYMSFCVRAAHSGTAFLTPAKINSDTPDRFSLDPRGRAEGKGCSQLQRQEICAYRYFLIRFLFTLVQEK